MAKAPNTPAASPATAAIGEFDLGLEVPAVKRSAGNGGNSERRDKLMRMPIGASFLETVNVPESIKDDAEREKAFNDLCRKLSNSLSGAGRRVSKAAAAYNFEGRTVNDPKLGKGVRIWRTAPKTAAAPSPATAGDNQGAASA